MSEDALLNDCEDKLSSGAVYDVCPLLRRCPKCKLLLEHKSNCRWITCFCKHGFCFVCGRGSDACVHSWDPCKNGYNRS